MSQSPTIGKLAEALAKAQAKYSKAVKDAANPFFNSKYVDLAGCYDACRAALAEQGLSVVQTTMIPSYSPPAGPTEKPIATVLLVSTLIHSSGEWISGEYPISPVKTDPQGYGSAMTYARRYALMALVGIAAENEDDDGEVAVGRAAKVTSKGLAAKKIPVWSDDQKLEVGKYFADINELPTGEQRIRLLREKMKYDPPTDVIDAAAELLRELESINTQANESTSA